MIDIMASLLSYIVALVVFGILDGLWLWSMSSRIYRPVLGDILLTDVRLAPAIPFYLAYPGGLTLMAVTPAVLAGDWSMAVVTGAMLGGFAYCTYDLTNYATLRNWTLKITVIDIFYGTAVAAIASLAGFFVTRTMFGSG